MWLKAVVSTFVLMTASGGDVNNSTRVPVVDIKELFVGLSDQNQATLVNPEYDAYIKNFTAHHPPTRPYEQFQPSSLLRGRDWSWNQIQKKMRQEDRGQSMLFKQYVNRNPGSQNVKKSCFILSSIYQRARVDILKYYKLRDFYVNTLEYEIGYLCHIIIAKYMNMLELYEIVVNRYSGKEAKAERQMTMPPRYMFYIYVNIIEYSKSIIHYCNMLHEIEYKYEEAAEETQWNDFNNKLDNTTSESTLKLKKHQKQLEQFLKDKKARQEQKRKENSERHRLGKVTTQLTTRSLRPVR